MKILVIDDERNITSILKDIFEDDNHLVEVAFSGNEGINLFKTFLPDITFLDVAMPGTDGITVLEKIIKFKPESIVIMISGHSNIATAVTAIKIGAYDFLEKPLSLPIIDVTLEKAIQHIKMKQKVVKLSNKMKSKYSMIGQSDPIIKLKKLISKVAKTNAKVLIEGESGTGKELVAWAIHEQSPRKNNDFVVFNSAAIPNELVESELFGYEQGAFTGAKNSKPGKIEDADNGTLFLDEIGDMSLSAQAKILRVIQEGEFERVGANKTISIDARIVAATHKNLKQLVSEGKFREDLYYRLNVIPINVPPLRERNDDIPLLIQHFSNINAEEMKTDIKHFSNESLDYLKNYAFPGNIRELRNFIERLYIVCDENNITIDLVKDFLQSPRSQNDFWKETTKFSIKKTQFEKKYLQLQLHKFSGNISLTAKHLGLKQSNLSRKLKELDINIEKINISK